MLFLHALLAYAAASITTVAATEITVIPGVLNLNPDILTGGKSLINLNLFANILGKLHHSLTPLRLLHLPSRPPRFPLTI